MRHLYENGVWAIFSTLDPSVLQFKPGILMTQDCPRTCCAGSRSPSAGRRRKSWARAAERPADGSGDRTAGRYFRLRSRHARQAEMVLERARWASQVFQRYDRERTLAIADAAASAAFAKAGEYGDWAVRGNRLRCRRTQKTQERALQRAVWSSSTRTGISSIRGSTSAPASSRSRSRPG